MNKLTTTLLGLLFIIIGSCDNPHGEIFRQESNAQGGYNLALVSLPD